MGQLFRIELAVSFRLSRIHFILFKVKVSRYLFTPVLVVVFLYPYFFFNYAPL